MTKAEKKVAELEKRIADLEARPQIIVLPAPVQINPYNSPYARPYAPPYNPWGPYVWGPITSAGRITTTFNADSCGVGPVR